MSFNTSKAIIRLGIKFEEGAQLSRKKIEEWLHISSRTAYHYIEELRKQFNAPIIYDKKARCYYCAGPWSIIEQLKS